MNWKLLALGKGFQETKLEGCNCASFPVFFSRELFLVAVHGWFALQTNICYFKPVCLLVKMASKTVIRSILGNLISFHARVARSSVAVQSTFRFLESCSQFLKI